MPVLSWSLVASRSEQQPGRPLPRSQHDPRKGWKAGPNSAHMRSLAQSSHQTQARFPHRPDWPDPQSQSFSRSYGSNLPTSLTYIILSTRGYSPWRPDADMGTDRSVDQDKPPLSRVFKGRRRYSGRRKNRDVLRSHDPIALRVASRATVP